jgi:hypothetical protein
MKNMISYKNCLIRSQSFQFGQSGSWIPRYTVTQQGADRDAPSHHDRLDQACWTESEADEFAVQDAKRRVDSD